MAVEDRSLSEFPRALQVAEQALVMISNPDGLGGYDTNGAVLTEVGKALLNVQYTQQLGNVSVFDAIKNTRVLSGTTTPTANEGANGQLYVKYETVSNVDTVIGMYFKKDGAWLEISLGGGGGSSYVELTQAEYDAMEQAGTLDPTVMYFITDGQSGGGATELADLTDVDLTSPADGQLLRYNGTSGKWENAGIINDTTASASSVYSSNKVNSELALKQNSTDNSLTTTNKQIVPAINELVSGKADKVVVVTGVTKNSNIIGDAEITVLRIDKVVFVKAHLKAKAQITTSDQILLSGLPERSGYRNANTFPCAVGNEYFNTDSEVKGVWIDGSGNLNLSSTTTINSDRAIIVDFWYYTV